MPKVTILMGSKADLKVAEKATGILGNFGIAYDIFVASAHRTPSKVEKIVKESESDVFIAIAGLSAALPGVVASFTLKPVIGVPVSGKVNLDSILSVVQMPGGIPVACVGLDRGDNAAILAAQILATRDEGIKRKLLEHREEMAGKIEADSREVASLV